MRTRTHPRHNRKRMRPQTFEICSISQSKEKCDMGWHVLTGDGAEPRSCCDEERARDRLLEDLLMRRVLPVAIPAIESDREKAARITIGFELEVEEILDKHRFERRRFLYEEVKPPADQAAEER